MLGQTATAGASEITLLQPVQWRVGDEIVIATTGHRHSQIENEQHVIQAISADGLTITLEVRHKNSTEFPDQSTPVVFVTLMMPCHFM
jgi:hypothetical protein